MAKQTANRKRRNVSDRRQDRRQFGRQQVVESVRSTTTFARADLFIAIGLVAATLAVYAQVMGHQFIILDDKRYILENPMVRQGLRLTGIAWAFTTFHASNWHPLTWLSHMVDSQLFGLNAGGHLLVNALFHVSNTLLLFLFLRRLTGARWQSAIVAALFALHPLHVESVAWAAERKDMLSTFFGLLTLLAYASYVANPFVEALRLGRGCVGARPHGQANACNMAFCFAVARLLAISPIPAAPRNWNLGVFQSTWCRWFARNCSYSVSPQLRW